MKKIFSLIIATMLLAVMAIQAQNISVDNWQEQRRGEGLANFYRILPNIMLVNAQDKFVLNEQAKDYDLNEIPSVARLLNHPGVGGMVIINKEGDILLEHYRNGESRLSAFSDQSSTKSMGYLLLNQAIKDGVISLDDKVEKYIPEVGSGFRGRTIGDVASMNVNHNIDELLAYTGDPEALEMFDRDERVLGFQRNDEKETLNDFVKDIKAGGKNGSNEWNGEIARYTTVNTNVLSLAIINAYGAAPDKLVRQMLHKIGGENPVYMGTDFDGIPMLGGAMISSTIDFARYGRLLIEDEEQVIKDGKAAVSDGQPVPAELTFVESKYYKSAIHNEYGIGHSGWGGQLIWADPVSGVIIAINSTLESVLPAPYDHFYKEYEAAIDIVKFYRSKK